MSKNRGPDIDTVVGALLRLFAAIATAMAVYNSIAAEHPLVPVLLWTGGALSAVATAAWLALGSGLDATSAQPAESLQRLPVDSSL